MTGPFQKSRKKQRWTTGSFYPKKQTRHWLITDSAKITDLDIFFAESARKYHTFRHPQYPYQDVYAGIQAYRQQKPGVILRPNGPDQEQDWIKMTHKAIRRKMISGYLLRFAPWHKTARRQKMAVSASKPDLRQKQSNQTGWHLTNTSPNVLRCRMRGLLSIGWHPRTTPFSYLVSCHPDMVLISPVAQTTSHPDAVTLGSSRSRLCARRIASVTRPIALGGVTLKRSVRLTGFYGFAGSGLYD